MINKIRIAKERNHMKCNKVYGLLTALLLLLVLSPAHQVEAKVQSFPNLYMEIDIPDDTLVLNQNTPNSDELWKQVGITDPKKEKETMSEMGVQAILFDPNTDTLVNVLSKRTNETVDIFHLSNMDEEELEAYLATLFDPKDTNSTHQIAPYLLNDIPFYRLSIELKQEGDTYNEVIYATIINGASLSFNIYKVNNQDPLDETYIKLLVEGTSLTDIIDKSEYEQLQQESILRLVAILLVVILVIFIWVLIRRKSNKKEKEAKQKKAEALSLFYLNQRQKEEENVKDSPLFTNHTKYTANMIKNFHTYDLIWKNPLRWAVLIIIGLVLSISFYLLNALLWCLICIVIVIAMITMQYLQSEKLTNLQIKTFKDNKNKDAHYTFYDDYYTLSGLQSISKYPYIQILDVKEDKNCYYLYVDANRAHYVAKDGFDSDRKDFKEFLSKRSKIVLEK